MDRLPFIREITAGSSGWGFFLCSQKEIRPGRGGEFLALTLQDATGQLPARIFDDVERFKEEFDAGDFVKMAGRANLHNGRLQIIIERVRRVHVEQDRLDGFSEADCLRSAPVPAEEMWVALRTLVAGVANPFIRALLQRILEQHEAKLKTWPAAQTVHHAYRAGFLEHVLKVATVARSLAVAYEADADVVVAGAVLHDIGKLQELESDLVTGYTRDGNLVGHIALGLLMVRDASRTLEGFPPGLLTHLEHLILSHHGQLELGSPVEPKTAEAFILAAADGLDATLHQVRRALSENVGEGEFTTYQPRLGRALWKGLK